MTSGLPWKGHSISHSLNKLIFNYHGTSGKLKINYCLFLFCNRYIKGVKAGHYLSGTISYLKTNDKKNVVRCFVTFLFLDLLFPALYFLFHDSLLSYIYSLLPSFRSQFLLSFLPSVLSSSSSIFLFHPFAKLPAHPLTHLPTYLRTYLPTYLPTYLLQIH